MSEVPDNHEWLLACLCYLECEPAIYEQQFWQAYILANHLTLSPRAARLLAHRYEVRAVQ